MPNKERKGKWQPYDGLEGYRNVLESIEYEKGKVAKPILLPDQLEELNEQLEIAVTNNKDVRIIYYKNGYFSEIEGLITKVDLIQKAIFINFKKIPVNLIQKIIIL
jgi:hypothetical protein